MDRQPWKAVSGSCSVRLGVRVVRGAALLRDSQRTSRGIFFDVPLAPARVRRRIADGHFAGQLLLDVDLHDVRG